MENKTDARLIVPDKNTLPEEYSPGCGDYQVAIRYSIAITGNQNFLYVFDPTTTLKALVDEWLANAGRLVSADYPDDPATNWSLVAANSALQAISTQITASGHGNVIFSTYIQSPDVYRDVQLLLDPFKATYAPAIGYIGFDVAKLPALATLLKQTGLLHPLTVRGIGDMTLRNLYYTPALSKELAGIGKPFIDDDTVNIVHEAQELGLLMVPARCSDRVPEDPAFLEAHEAEMLSQTPYCCCNNSEHIGSYRKCKYIPLGTPSCNTCGTACCLAGVSWCTASHSPH
jgi:hypothetical protein